MSSQETLAISSRREAGHGVVTLVGELDLAGAAALTTAVQHALSDLSDPPIDALELDLSELSFADSAGLQALLAAQDTTRLAGVAFRLVGVTPVISRVIHLARVDHLLLSTGEDGPPA